MWVIVDGGCRFKGGLRVGPTSRIGFLFLNGGLSSSSEGLPTFRNCPGRRTSIASAPFPGVFELVFLCLDASVFICVSTSVSAYFVLVSGQGQHFYSLFLDCCSSQFLWEVGIVSLSPYDKPL